MLEKLGANHLGGGTYGFLLWAPLHEKVRLKLLSPTEAVYDMKASKGGYFMATVNGLKPGTRYVFELPGGMEFPDPVSRWQPDGVHGASALVDHGSFLWTDGMWGSLPLEDYILYELHVGTFTPEGTFDAAIKRISHLKELGITAVELMPVAQFPGSRNWGYDGTYPYAVQESYGGPEGLKRFVDSCHSEGIAVVLDVVYNHLGPEGNYSLQYGPYLTGRYRTPWGMAVNFDGPWSDGVRRFFIENARYWFDEYHIDALRLDAVHGIVDMSATHFLRELGETISEHTSRTVYLIPESDLNDVRLVDTREHGGHGLDAQWLDDFHHCVHTLLTGESDGYYVDYGSLEHLAQALNEGFVYSGQYSEFRKKQHGNSSAHIDPWRFIVFIQNHDQVGNRMEGDRLAASLGIEQLKLAAALVILGPSVPLLFMGEEYGETAPFQYFVSHGDPDLIDAVRKGRREEFSSFSWKAEAPDPQDEGTFVRSKIDLSLKESGIHKELFDFYKSLIRLRKELKALRRTKRGGAMAHIKGTVLITRIDHNGEALLSAANFSGQRASLTLPADSSWSMLVDLPEKGTSDNPTTINGQIELSPFGFMLFTKQE